MPIYEYKCESCSTVLEKLQKISEPPLSDCPECGKSTLVRLVSAPSFRLKGTGWYETDFKTGKKKNGVGSESDSASKSSDSSSSGGASGSSSDSSSAPARTGTD
jgi:putative regulatory protein, FmdB family